MKVFALLFAFIGLSTFSFCAPPDWKVEANDYSNSMTFTGVVQIDGVEKGDDDGLIAAFVNDSCRGVVDFSSIENTNRFYALLLVYSNSTGNETIRFKYYDSNNDSIVELENIEEFLLDASEGSFSNPYIFTNQSEVEDFISFTFIGLESETVVDDFLNIITIDIKQDADLSDLIAEFELSGEGVVKIDGVIQESGVTSNDFSNEIVFTVCNSLGDEVVWTVVVKVSVGFGDMFSSKSLFYPNPCNEYLTINSNKGAQVQIADMSGKVLIDKEVNGNSIDVSSLKPGVHVLQVDQVFYSFLKE